MKISIQNLTKIIKGNVVTDNISIELQNGNVYGLCGDNGCGKTMMMRLIAGLILPTKGTVTFDGKTLGKEIDFPPKTGVLIENPAFIEGKTGLENLKLLSSINSDVSEELICKAIARVGLNPKDKKKFRKYSLGMKQRLGIAAAIMEKPDLIILDEPTNALDSSGVQLTKKIIAEERERGALVIMTCHDYSVLENVCNVIFTIENGKIINRSDVRGME